MKQLRIYFFLILGCAILAGTAEASDPKVMFSTTTLAPGEALRVELDQVPPRSHYRVYFRGKVYPVYEIGPNAQRGLVAVPLGSPAGPYPLRIKRLEGNPPRWVEPREFSIFVASATYPIEDITLPPQKMALFQYEDQEGQRIHKVLHTLTPEQRWEGEFSPPVEGKIEGEFGVTRLANHKPYEFHKGVDLEAKEGTPVRAANSGRVLLAHLFKLHGRTVIVDHGQGVMTIYLHMKSFSVKPGQVVVKGQKLGEVGSTGLSTGAHVHWGLYVHAVPVNPQPWVENEF